MKKPQKKERIVTYLEPDLFKWVAQKAKKMRLNESAFVRHTLSKQMEASK